VKKEENQRPWYGQENKGASKNTEEMGRTKTRSMKPTAGTQVKQNRHTLGKQRKRPTSKEKRLIGKQGRQVVVKNTQ